MFYARIIIVDELHDVDSGERRYKIFETQQALNEWYKGLDDVQKVCVEAVGPCEFNSKGILYYDTDHEQHLHD